MEDLLQSIDSYRSRRALTLSFNEGQAGVIYADVLVYLTIEYLGQIKTNLKKLEANDGFMVKTPRDAEVELGLSQDKVRLVYKGLETAGIIEIKKKGQDNRTCLKVNLEAVNARLNEFIPKFEQMKQEYVIQQTLVQDARKERAKKNAQGKLNFDLINELSEENIPSKLGAISEDYETLALIYTVNHYYKKYTSKNFVWSPVKFNTLMTTWRNRGMREGSELGMSYALYTELNSKGFGKERPFELRVRETFNPDIRPNAYDHKLDNVIYDNILKQSTTF